MARHFVRNLICVQNYRAGGAPTTATVVHFGLDDCHRIDVPGTPGYEVCQSSSLDELASALQKNEQVDAVIVSEDERRITELAAELAHSMRVMLVILFRRSEGDLTDGSFDRGYSSLNSPDIWLSDIKQLIALCHTVREMPPPSQEDAIESAVVTHRLRERLAAEMKRNAPPRLPDSV